MQTSSLYPLLQVPDVEATARFYETMLGFSRLFTRHPHRQVTLPPLAAQCDLSLSQSLPVVERLLHEFNQFRDDLE